MKNQIHFLGRPKGKNSLALSTLAIDKNDKRTCIDCGKGMLPPVSDDGATQVFGPDISSILDSNKIDRILSTHPHFDHVGYIHPLCHQGLLSKDARIWGTPQTNAIIDIAANDDLRNGTDEFSYFDYADVGERLSDIPKAGENIIDGEPMYFSPVGHMPGATSIMIRTPSDRVALIFGDACWHDQASVRGGLWPSEWPNEWIPDELWNTDLTYASGGMSEDKTYEEKKQDFYEAISSALGVGKTVIVQGFASGKIPNAAYDLALAGIPCWIDSSMAFKVMETFSAKRWSDRDNIVPAPGNGSGINKIKGLNHRLQLMEDGQPKVILATGGMGDFGPILDWYKWGLPKANVAFFPTSYLAPGSNGARLVDLMDEWIGKQVSEENRIARLRFQKKRGDPVERVNIPVRAQVQRFGLSSHGTFGEFIHFLTQLKEIRGGKPLERIFLTHGTEEAMNRVRSELKIFAKEVIPGHLIKTAEII